LLILFPKYLKIMTKTNVLRLAITCASVTLLSSSLLAKEGMWQPSQLKRQENEMKKLGLQISADQLYNNEGTGLNNAVVLFGGGCTGEMVSPQGLLFTNHHCGYSNAQALSTTDNNYLTDGFWAKSLAEEKPCPGLKVSFVRKTENVSEYIFKGLDTTASPTDQDKYIKSRIKELEKAYKNLTGYDAEIKPFYNGNEYWVSLMETFTDVRLVGFPPNGIGKFGADTDNWMWPRMTGDFAIFRVYANKEGKPAPYQADNIPYKTPQYFPINTSGYQPGDYTMVYGFPGTTQQYISSFQVAQVQDIIDPIRIASRAKKLAIWDDAMRADKGIFLKYAAKQSSISNGYKKWQGEVLGLTTNNVVAKKEKYERLYQEAAVNNANNAPEDQQLLSNLQATVNSSSKNIAAAEYTNETVNAIELINQSQVLERILNIYRAGINGAALADTLKKLKPNAQKFYKNYDAHTDSKVFESLMPFYMQQGEGVVAPTMKTLLYNAGNNYDTWRKSVYNNSICVNENAFYTLLDHAQPSDSIAIKQDPAYQIYNTANSYFKKELSPELKKQQERIATLNRKYMKSQLQYMNPYREFYPDANLTLRLTYGTVEPVKIPGSNIFQTTLEDLIPRHNPNVEEFNLPKGLIDLYHTKNYGRWAVNNTVPVNFIATNHTSGGNSGSPVLNAKGELIGINFDRIWQGTMSDLNYDAGICRNVSVDIRYVLFTIEKFGNASWLLKEMKLVK
jgi:hypothetical protein